MRDAGFPWIILLTGVVLSGAFLPSPGASDARRTANAQPDRTVVPPLFRANDLSGKAVRVPVEGAKATVVALTGTTCPLSQKYGPTLSRLEDVYAPKGVRFVFVNPSSIEPVADMKAQVRRLGLDGPYLSDRERSVARALGAKTTTEVFVLDDTGRIRYRGGVDDQYVIGASLPAPRHRFLADALDAVLAGKEPGATSAPAPGCLLADEETSGRATPTYHGAVEHILRAKCVSCHRTGGVAPFALDTYESVKARAAMLRYVTERGLMPPWFAAKNAGGPWRNDMSLPDADRKTLYAWIEGGMPAGDPKDAPAPVRYTGGWTIGKPDAVFELPRPIAVKATGTMPYQNVNVPTGFTEDRWVRKIEVMPGDRRVVHHVLVFVRTPETAATGGRERLAERAEELGGFFGVYVPGNSALIYPDGLAKRIPRGAVLRFQIHYTPNGTATTDRTKIGLVFAETPPRSEVHTASIANLRFAIPPGADHHEVTAQLRVPTDVRVLSYLPHMRVRGKAARYEHTREGKTTTLLDIPRYDFNWQLNYVLAEPLDVRAGDQVTFRAWYDNSDRNPANPDPGKTVRWGAQTFDEMHLGYVEYIVPGQKPGESGNVLRRFGRGERGTGLEAIFGGLDKDRDGFVTESEAPRLWARIRGADANGDGRLSLEEAKTFFSGQRR
ncbi:MAG: redoxin family protein [Capsulimonadales bacterium]|nr:redoxin family protein [Capsulimonadales bacterium]